jgi:hypothetical protein
MALSRQLCQRTLAFAELVAGWMQHERANGGPAFERNG